MSVFVDAVHCCKI